MDDESMRNISLSRMELYDLIGALDVAIAKYYDNYENEIGENEEFFIDEINRKSKLLKRLEEVLGE